MTVATASTNGSVAPRRATRRLRTLRRAARRFLDRRPAVLVLGLLVLLAVVAVLAPFVAPHDPNAQVLSDRLLGPGEQHWLGTDDLGRDVFSRMVFASRVSLLAAVEATAIAAALGVPVGLAAGYVGGAFDLLAGRVADALLSVPGLLLALAIVGILGPSVTNAMLAVGVVYAPRLFRVVRASTLAVRDEAYVDAARAIGVPRRRIIAGHVLPNILSPLAVELSLAAGFALLAEAGLSFLGLGVQPPDASWGSMLGRSTRFMNDAPLLVVVPGTAIFLTVLATNVVGDALRDAFGTEGRDR